MSSTSTRSHGTTTAPVVVASNDDDAAAVEAVRAHHAQLAGALAVRVDAVVRLAGTPDRHASDAARDALAGFCAAELLPHAAAEEQALYPVAAADDRARLLVEAMIAEHRVLEGLVGDLGAGADPIASAALGTALRVLFETHLAKENDLLLPLVAGDPSRSLAGALAGMHELLGPEAHDEHPDRLPRLRRVRLRRARRRRPRPRRPRRPARDPARHRLRRPRRRASRRLARARRAARPDPAARPDRGP